ncbi:MAG: peptidase C1 [Bacteroidetes bacterium]|nr:peptidase C1 [Bacteroidota bacterium]
MKKQLVTTVAVMIAILFYSILFAQERKDKAQFKPRSNEFYEQVQKGVEAFEAPKKADKPLALRMDFTGMDVPKSMSEFKTVFAQKPESQGETGTCWCFSTTSFYESEIKRLSNLDIQLSELYTVYWQYVEKAKEFVRTRGTSAFDEGSETNGVAAMMKQYGIVPLDAYNGMKIGQPYHNHSKMVNEMKAYLQGIKTANNWNTDEIVSTIKSIMNFYLGEPPTSVTIAGKKMTPLEYLKNVTKLNPDDYVDFMSFMEAPYWTQAEYKVSDNWWHSADYYNVPLNDYMSIIKSAIKSGYSMSIGGDVSESGMDNKLGVAMIPTYDIPSAYIDEYARQMRFTNGSTTDDHAMHLVGYEEKTNGTWYLIKDSGSGGQNNQTAPGYWYMHEDFIKLKMTSFTIHKDAVKEILAKFPKKP